MVERPIKKSDRQAKIATDNNPENVDSTPPVESTPKIIKKRDDNSSGRGKKAAVVDESRQQVNPALARGPKPVKSQPKVVEPETDATSDEPQGEALQE
ncbi:hypothetical protein [Iningainema tapete]|uniref:Uncharacterized protein n=1 Tax=Iningainema tapete BLCC-T55 TaxID=2748662 RepID=A0A8J6XGF6_9CYAN|nr:hypothetical protein [Iningainema tapete]MBD2771274.1 hypothetical protein [Iningainema tapete BLCC-T55]